MWGTTQPPGPGPWPTIEARDRSFFRQMVEVLRPSNVVEFGSWEGSSALAWASAARDLGTDIHMYCLDTWLGSPEHWSNVLPDTEWGQEHLRIVDGEPHVFDTFRNAITSHGLNGSVSPVRATTECGTVYLKNMGIRADIVYVDADHSYSAVRRDLFWARSLLSSGGIVTGDDWHHMPIKRAVLEHAMKYRAAILTDVDESVFLLIPPEWDMAKRDALTHLGYRTESIARITAVLSRAGASRVARAVRR